MSGPAPTGEAPTRTARLITIKVEAQVESPALATALLEVLRAHAEAYGFSNLESVETEVVVSFSNTAYTPADVDGFRRKLNALWLGGITDVTTDEVEVQR